MATIRKKYLLEQNCITYFIKIVDFILFLHPKKLDQSLVGDEERSFIEVFDLNSHYHPKKLFPVDTKCIESCVLLGMAEKA